MASTSSILASAASAVGPLRASRDAGTAFLRHATAIPFPDAGGGTEAFHVAPGESRPLGGFGLPDGAHREHVFYIYVGHPAFGTDVERGGWLADDVAKVSDAVEAAAYEPGTLAVFFVESTTDRQRASWWVTTMKFRAEFVELAAP